VDIMADKKKKPLLFVKQIIVYGLILGALGAVLKLSEFNLVVINNTFELYSIIVALIFCGVGIWVGLKLTRKGKQIIVVEGAGIPGIVDEEKIKELGISKREYEVLELIAKGHTNQEVADRLFVSANTIKTHLTNIFAKLEVNRRTQAIQRAKDLNILP
jgi:two-component system, NarL family, response regulator LiaR